MSMHAVTARRPAPRPVSRPHDPDEREAERAAEVVARGGSVANWSFAGAGSPSDPAPVQRRAHAAPCLSDACGAGVDGAIAHPGSPLEGSTRRFMETAFAYDFGSVRLHSDSRSAASARALGATAYTVGHDVVTADGPPAVASEPGRRLLAHELAHVVQHGRSADTRVVHRQAATPSAPTPPAPASPIRVQNVGRGGNRVDAEYDRANALLTVQVKVQFDWGTAPPKEWPQARRDAWQNSFVRTVTRRWSFKHLLVPQQPCLSEPQQAAVRFQVIPVTSSPHFTIHMRYVAEGDSQVRQTYSATGQLLRGEADLSVFDDAMRSDYPQVVVEHEFGHMLGLPHIRCKADRPECYGVTRQEKADIMGVGSYVSPRDYEPFAELMVPPLTTCTWRVSPRSAIPTSRGPLIGGLIGGALGAAAGILFGGIFGPIGAIVGGLAGAAGGAALGAYLGTPEVPS